MSGLIKRDVVKVKTIYHQMLIFILKNKNVFKMVVGRGGVRVLEKMIKKIEVIIMTEYALPKNCEKLLNIYRKEVVGVIERWIKSGFLEDELMVLSDIMYLTKTMRSRLGPLNE